MAVHIRVGDVSCKQRTKSNSRCLDRRTLMTGDEKAVVLMKFRYGDCGRLPGGEPPGGDAVARMVLSGVHVIDDGGEPTTSGSPVSEFSTYGPAAQTALA